MGGAWGGRILTSFRDLKKRPQLLSPQHTLTAPVAGARLGEGVQPPLQCCLPFLQPTFKNPGSVYAF